MKKLLLSLLMFANAATAQTFTPTPDVYPLLGDEPVEEPLVAEDREDLSSNSWGDEASDSESDSGWGASDSNSDEE